MRALGLCLLTALCLNAPGCNNPGQPPSLDPFARTTVPPPGTGLAAPPSPYSQPSNATGVTPQSRLPGKRTSQTNSAESVDETGSGWRGSDTPKTRLASTSEADDSRVENADGEFSDNEESRVNTAEYQEDVPEAEEQPPARKNPVRTSGIKVRGNEDGAEVGVE